MTAEPIDMVGDIEDPHILFDSTAHKWRMLTCENLNGYKAVVLESDEWNKGYQKIAGPVAHNSTGTSIQKIGDQLFCFSGSSDRKIYIYTVILGSLNWVVCRWTYPLGMKHLAQEYGLT